MVRAGLLCAVFSAASLSGPVSARSRGGPPPIGVTEVGLQPSIILPELIKYVEPSLPQNATLTEDLSIELELLVEADGHVGKVSAVDPHHTSFEDHAIDAASQLYFRPATLNGEAVAAKILFTYDFPAPAPVVPPLTNEDELEPEQERVITLRAQSRSVPDQRRHSSDAVEVIELQPHDRAEPDLSTIVARNSGVAVRQTGGLGNPTVLSIGGLEGTRLPIFFEGLPLDSLGFPLGLASIPTAFVERIDVYRGVAPIYLGSDALAGAVDLIGPTLSDRFRLSVQYTGGSFDTHRVAAGGHLIWPDHDLFIRGNAFFDNSNNDYKIDAEVADMQGRPQTATVRRFHDKYLSGGGGLEVGIRNRRFADHLSIRGFGTATDKDIQHDPSNSTTPYGEVTTWQRSTGAILRYQTHITPTVTLSLTGGYSYHIRMFIDEATCIYDWYGRCLLDRANQRGETGGRDYRQELRRHVGFGRIYTTWAPHLNHQVSLSVAPNAVQRHSDDRRDLEAPVFDPLSGRRDVFQLTSGIAYQATLFDARLENNLFVKDYVFTGRADDPQENQTYIEVRRHEHHIGFGDAIRVSPTPWMDVKLSYEWTTRFPTPDELFGDNIVSFANLDLQPERSHNLNLGAHVHPHTRVGDLFVRADGFARLTQNLIVFPLEGDSFQNIGRARAFGIEGEFRWTSPGDWVALHSHITWQDIRNTANDGPFEPYHGDRVPYQPWLLSRSGARFQVSGLGADNDVFSLGWDYNYVYRFLLNWESQGASDTKLSVPSQHLHTFTATYRATRRKRVFQASLTISNITDQKNYDYYGIQKPGRAVYATVAIEL